VLDRGLRADVVRVQQGRFGTPEENSQLVEKVSFDPAAPTGEAEDLLVDPADLPPLGQQGVQGLPLPFALHVTLGSCT
jgi:hypothetical protein